MRKTRKTARQKKHNTACIYTCARNSTTNDNARTNKNHKNKPKFPLCAKKSLSLTYPIQKWAPETEYKTKQRHPENEQRKNKQGAMDKFRIHTTPQNTSAQNGNANYAKTTYT